jgi:hypothetical protein
MLLIAESPSSTGDPIFKTKSIFGTVQIHLDQGDLLTANHVTATSITYLTEGRTMLKVFNPNKHTVPIKKGDLVGEFIEDREEEYDVYLLEEIETTKETRKIDENTETTIEDLCVPGTSKLRDVLKEIGKELQEPIQINNVRVEETTQIRDISKPQPVSERDYEDDGQIPHKDLPHFSKAQLDKMTKKEIDEIIASTPLKFIDLEHKYCVLKTSDIYEAKKFLIEYIEVFSANDSGPGEAAHETGARMYVSNRDTKIQNVNPHALPRLS